VSRLGPVANDKSDISKASPVRPAQPRDEETMPPKRADGREKLLTKLQKHAGAWIPDIECIKDSIVASYYLSLPNYCGAAIGPSSQRYYLDTGEEITFKDVPLIRIVRDIASQIGKHVPADRRNDVYHSVLVGMTGYRKVPEWDKNPAPQSEAPSAPESDEDSGTASVNAKPLTPFSAPRDGKTSKQLFDALASAGGIARSEIPYHASAIIIRDGQCDGKHACTLKPGGKWEVSGGRLGRDHTLEDVPVHFVRDCLMDQIGRFMISASEGRKQAWRKALCSDLTDDEIAEYARVIDKDRVRTFQPGFSRARDEEAKRVLAANKGNKSVRSYKQAMEVVMLNEAFDGVDGTVDYKTSKKGGHTVERQFEGAPKTISRSVVLPRSAPLEVEKVAVPRAVVDKDCDQVRAMIKTFCSSGDWTLDYFREALGPPAITREKLATFLSKRGDDFHQQQSAAYLMGWEFFERRQKLGLEVADVAFREDEKTVTENAESICKQVIANERRKTALFKRHRREMQAVLEDQERALAILEEAQEKEYMELRYSQMRDMSDLEDTQKKEIWALEDAPPVKVNKRASSGRGGGRKKKARS